MVFPFETYIRAIKIAMSTEPNTLKESNSTTSGEFKEFEFTINGESVALRARQDGITFKHTFADGEYIAADIDMAQNEIRLAPERKFSTEDEMVVYIKLILAAAADVTNDIKLSEQLNMIVEHYNRI